MATFSQTWPRYGILAHGECFQLPPWVQDTGVNAFGELSGDGIEAEAESTRWPTVTVKGNGNRSEYGGKSGDGLDTAVKRAEESALWPTPQRADAKQSMGQNRDGRQIMLIHAIRDRAAKSATWPTPTAHDRMPGTTKPHGFIIDGKEMQQNLNDVVIRRIVSSLWPTPCATDHKGSGQNGADRDRLDYAVERGKTKSHIYPTVGTKTMGGKDTDTANCRLLNPDWVEWLMGWPIRWTDIAITSDVFYWLDLSDDPANWKPPLIRRITTRKKHRAKRIETLGNGQVPLCAAVAFVWGFEILRVIVEGNEIGLRL